MWCGISGRVPITPLNVLRWKSNPLTFKKRFSSLFFVNVECDPLICLGGAKTGKFESKESLHFLHFANYSVPSTLFFLLQLYNFLFVFVVSTREKRSNAMNSKKAKWNKIWNKFKIFSINPHLAIFIHNLGPVSRGHGFKSRWSPEFFFQASLTQLHKLCSQLRESFFTW